MIGRASLHLRLDTWFEGLRFSSHLTTQWQQAKRSRTLYIHPARSCTNIKATTYDPCNTRLTWQDRPHEGDCVVIASWGICIDCLRFTIINVLITLISINLLSKARIVKHTYLWIRRQKLCFDCLKMYEKQRLLHHFTAYLCTDKYDPLLCVAVIASVWQYFVTCEHDYYFRALMALQINWSVYGSSVEFFRSGLGISWKLCIWQIEWHMFGY